MPWETRAAANADDDPRVTLGFMPLVDSAPLIVAHALGFATDEGLELTLMREISWANIRDRVVVGRFDAAQMLAPMPIASSLGLGPIATPMAAPLSLGRGGKAVTLTRDLFARMEAEGASLQDAPRAMGEALARVVARLATVLRIARTSMKLRVQPSFETAPTHLSRSRWLGVMRCTVRRRLPSTDMPRQHDCDSRRSNLDLAKTTNL